MYAKHEKKNTFFERKQTSFLINEETEQAKSEKSDENSVNAESVSVKSEGSSIGSISSLSSDMSDAEIQARLEPEQIKQLIKRALSKNKLNWENLNVWDKI